MLNMTASISKMCLDTYIYIIIYVNIDERKVNRKRNFNYYNLTDRWLSAISDGMFGIEYL